MLQRFSGKAPCLFVLTLMMIAGAQPAEAAPLSQDCQAVLSSPIRDSFRNRADQIGYTDLYLGCWGQVMILNSKAAERSYIGNGLELFSNPAFVEASGFSRNLCLSIPMAYGRNDYPCWFEAETATQNVSLEEAARREAPKILFSDLQKARDGTDLLQLTVCMNDDPTKPKEYTQGCKRGYRAIISEYGRGDFNGDKVQDIMLTIKFGENTSQDRNCYMASFTRKDNDYFKLLNFSWMGLCQ